MAPDTTENWWTVGQIVGAVLGGIVLTFLTIYQKSKRETRSEDVVQKSVGAAFVDLNAAKDLRSIAEDTRRIREIAEDEENRFKEQDLIDKAVEKLKHKQG